LKPVFEILYLITWGFGGNSAERMALCVVEKRIETEENGMCVKDTPKIGTLVTFFLIALFYGHF
jgi:hypothetical protein